MWTGGGTPTARCTAPRPRSWLTPSGAGIDPTWMHLHGRDISGPGTPYFAGMGLRYLWAVPSCLTEHGGVERIEVVHPTRTGVLDALRITPVDRSLLADADWSPA